jgi:hypothetical protein
MNPAQQIKKFRGHVLIFSEHLRYLIQYFEVPLPMAQNDALIDSFSGKKRARGFLTIRASLMQQCQIGITKLAYDAGPQNPTANQMAATLFNPDADPLRSALKAQFALPIKPAPAIGEVWSAEDEEMWQQEKKQQTEELRQAFEDQLKEIAQQWKWFANHHQKFKDLRDRHLAHLDISKVGKKYVLRKVAGLNGVSSRRLCSGSLKWLSYCSMSCIGKTNLSSNSANWQSVTRLTSGESNSKIVPLLPAHP